ncbi:MAG: SprT-like domain-containing protein [Pseudomonadota bacterium]
MSGNKSPSGTTSIGADKEIHQEVSGDKAVRRIQKTHAMKGAIFSECTSENGQLNPTTECMVNWVSIYDVTNRRLFGGQLPNCMITIERTGRAFGYFRPNSFKNRRGEITHQIAMNPEFFEPYGDLEALQTFLHEMCHLWREVLGPRNKNGCPGTPGYHCKIWGGKMVDVGLMPSHTGKPGGRKTGYQMMDYIIEGGKFVLLSRELLKNGMHVEWRDAATKKTSLQAVEEHPELEGMLLLPAGNGTSDPANPPKKRQTRSKYTCPNPDCGQNAMAGHNASLVCGHCYLPMKQNNGGKA